jgi:AcrR family transcriptional regulator
MPPSITEKLSPRARQIVEAARDLLESQGPDALTMRSLAKRLGIQAPSLYKHFASKEEIESALIAIALEEQTVLFTQSLDGSPTPLAAMGRAYRDFARRNPQLYRLMYDRPLNRSLLPAGLEDAAADAGEQVVGGDEALGRATWAFAHGMTILELNDRFRPGADLDAAWETGLGAISAAARRGRRKR